MTKKSAEAETEALKEQRRLQELTHATARLLQLRSQNRLFHAYERIWNPEEPDKPGAYPWQAEFHNAGSQYTERAIMAGNRTGKTSCAGAEVACHLTGVYPTWWQGRKFAEPVQFWVAGETNETTRDVIQEQLLGPEGAYGTGWVPAAHLIDKPKYRQAGVNNVVDQFFVKHSSGGISTCSLKTYEQGVEKWRGKKLDGVWLDEESNQKIYVEARTRILDRKGILILTATPHKGMTDVVRHFLEAKPNSGIYYKTVTWDDAPHLDKGAREELWNSYPEHERETRARGKPMLGAGAVFPIDEERITCTPFQIPPWFKRINGLDYGLEHPFGGGFCAHDGDSDTFYVYDCYKSKGETPVIHVAAMKKHGDWIPTAWPRDGSHREKSTGIPLRQLYKSQHGQMGLAMLKEHAHYANERGEHVEPGLQEMLEYMRVGKFKVFRGAGEPFLAEMRMYHRDEDGLLVKVNEDVISAVRYAFMMRRYARTNPGPGLLATSRAPSVPIAGRR